MTAERWQQIMETAGGALTREPAAREDFLQQVGSNDPDLRREVETLLTFQQVLKDHHDTKRELGSGAERTTRRAVGSGTVEIAHVLFTDIVGFGLLPMDQQKDFIAQIQQIVRDSPSFRAAEASREIISLPTGDGMALVFSGDPRAPVRCALEVAAELRSHPALKLRMGIHSGPVYRVADFNSNENVAGDGIIMAQRVMDCGDAGHILVSKNVADMLLLFRQWAPCLIDLGELSVKHCVKVHIYSLVTDKAGNSEQPDKLKAAAAPTAPPTDESTVEVKKSSTRLLVPLFAVLLLLGGGAAGAWWWWKQQHPEPQDTKQQYTSRQATKPDDTKPDDTKQVDTKQVDTKPDNTKPDDTKQSPPPGSESEEQVAVSQAKASITVNDALRFKIALAENVAANGKEEQDLRFTVVEGFKVGDTMVIQPRAAVTGSITQEAHRRFLRGSSKMTFRLLQADAVDGQKISVRCQSAKQSPGLTTCPVDTGKNPKVKGLAAAHGDEYTAYIDGDQTVSVRKKEAGN